MCLNRGQDTRANTVREPEPTHNELKHFLPGILPGVRKTLSCYMWSRLPLWRQHARAHHSALSSPHRYRRARVLYAADFFGRAAYLTVSGQLSAETYACALGDVYTFGPTFRAENSNTFSRKKRASLASYQSRPPRPGNFSATTQQRSPGGNFFSVRFSELQALGTAFGSSMDELTCSPRAFSSPPQSTMLRLVLALCVAAASGTLRLRVVAPARAAETSLPPLWRRTMGAAGGGCGDCAQRGCSIELRTRRRAASSSAGG